MAANSRSNWEKEDFFRRRKIMKRGTWGTALLSLASMVVAGSLLAADWKPTKPVTVIVPWPAGGSTDLTVRILASEMEKVLGQRIAVVNTPGASGSIGMKNAYDAPRDGYTWSSNSDTSLVNYPVLDLMKTTHREWIHWYALFSPSIISVTADYPAKDPADLVRIMKEKPGQVAVASAGVGSSGHTALEVFKSVTGAALRHVPYAGGNPAVVATVSGESNVVMQLSMEQADMIRAKKLKPLANTSNRPLNVSGFGEVPPITKSYPAFPLTGSHFGIMVPKDTPKEVVETIGKAFDVAARSDALKKFADEKVVFLVNLKEAEALDMADQTASITTWVLYDNGAAKISPAQFNIPRGKR
jgi:tripartite-type tricarboxylate transporter receptor subunit TctC